MRQLLAPRRRRFRIGEGPDGLRPIRPDETIMPAQLVLVILDGPPAAIAIVANGLQTSWHLAEQKRAIRTNRIAVAYRAIVPFEAPALVAEIERLAGGVAMSVSLQTSDLAEIAELALQQMVDIAIDVVTFVPRTTARIITAAGQNLFGPAGFGIGIGVVLVLVGVGAAVYFAKK